MTVTSGGAVPDPDQCADHIRAFNRFYTDLIGTLRKQYLGSPFNLPEARVVFEIGSTPGVTATEVRARAHFDQGHLSRILMRLERSGVIERRPSSADGRARSLRLTEQGQSLLDAMQDRAREQAHGMVAHLGAAARLELLRAMETIRGFLEPERRPPPLTIREGRPGDLGILLYRHAVLYREGFDFDERFEMYVAQGFAPFLQHFDPTKDRLWVAESAGRQVGTVAIHHVAERPGWAKLRWYLVDDEMRGQGVGTALIDEAVRFARQAGYAGIFLWTVDRLDAARRQYERHGFRLKEETDTCPWAPWAKEQKWERTLRTKDPAGPPGGAQRLEAGPR